MMDFKVTAKDADRVRQMLVKTIAGPHTGIDGSYEEGVIDTIAWLLGKSDYIANSKHQKEISSGRNGKFKLAAKGKS